MYLLTLDFQQGLPYYIRINDDGSWDEIYNPEFATEFPDAKDAVSWGAKNTTFGEYVKSVDKQEALEFWHKWISEGTVRRHFEPLSNLSRKYDPKKDDKYAVLEWRYQLQLTGEDVRYEDYKTWPDLFSIFDCLWSVETYYDHKDREKRLVTFQIAVRPETTFQQFQDDLNLILDKITYIDKEGGKKLSIMDHYCGEGGNFACLYLYPDGQAEVGSSYHSMTQKTSLENAFNYIKKHRYYD
jgi:hypothetical protein